MGKNPKLESYQDFPLCAYFAKICSISFPRYAFQAQSKAMKCKNHNFSPDQYWHNTIGCSSSSEYFILC